MNKYKYIDYKQSRKEIITIEAKCIIEADKIFEFTFGTNPDKISSIGCEIQKGG